MLLETAAIDLASEAVATDRLQGVSSHVMFVARGKVGPFRVEGEAIAGTAGTVAARAVLHDEGADDRVISSASYLLRVEPD